MNYEDKMGSYGNRDENKNAPPTSILMTEIDDALLRQPGLVAGVWWWCIPGRRSTPISTANRSPRTCHLHSNGCQ
jgi:hypothetical protein